MTIRPFAASIPVRVALLALGLVAVTGCQPAEKAGGTSDPVLSLPESFIPTEDTTRLRLASVDVLRQAMVSTDALLRMHAIEGLHRHPDIEWAVDLGLDDVNRAVRFAACISVGKLKLAEQAPRLTGIAANDESDSVRAAATYALYTNGLITDISELGRLLQKDDPEVRGNVAMILGELGNPSALPLLESVLGRPMGRTSPARARVTELQVAEAIVQLGDDRRLEGIRAALFSPGEEGELTALACQICGRLGDDGVAQRLHLMAVREGEQQQSAEVRMAAAWALGRLDPTRAPVSVPLAYIESPLPTHRAQAALTLGAIGRPSSLPVLERLLSDEDPLVQVSAAAAILRIIPV
ncbi:MAG: HEAT repeat domain-containing protein [Planctomycetota bacterium]|jgi:HEAT repeat protein